MIARPRAMHKGTSAWVARYTINPIKTVVRLKLTAFMTTAALGGFLHASVKAASTAGYNGG